MYSSVKKLWDILKSAKDVNPAVKNSKNEQKAQLTIFTSVLLTILNRDFGLIYCFLNTKSFANKIHNKLAKGIKHKISIFDQSPIIFWKMKSNPKK